MNSHSAPHALRSGGRCFSLALRALFAVTVTMLPTFGAKADIAPRVINGQPVTDVRYPWMVSLGTTEGSPADTHFCGGVLIAPQKVLTAAHCVYENAATPELFTVTVGRALLTDTAGEVLRVNGIAVHPAFNATTQENDIAVLFLAAPSTANEYVSPINAEEEGALFGSDTLLLGWGFKDPLYPVRPAALQQAHIPVQRPEVCAESLGLYFKNDSMLCAGTLASSAIAGDGIDACMGDSGGPLLAQSGGGWKIVGIVSWGFECGSSRLYGVYTRVAQFEPWLAADPLPQPKELGVPRVLGIPAVNQRLRCDPGRWQGIADITFQYVWRDFETGEILPRSEADIRVGAKDIGRRLQCGVTAMTRGSSATAFSTPTAPILPKVQLIRLSKKAKDVLEGAGTMCDARGSCRLLVAPRRPLARLRLVYQTSDSRWHTLSVRRSRLTAASSAAVKLPGKRVGTVFLRLNFEDGSSAVIRVTLR